MDDVIRRARFSVFTRARVRYSEIDAQGIVYNAHYLTYFDIGLHEFFRSGGYDYIAMLKASGVDTRVVHASVDYLGPVPFDSMLEIGVRVAKLGRSSITYELAIFIEGDDMPRASGSVIWVVADNETGRSTNIPAALRAALERIGR